MNVYRHVGRRARAAGAVPLPPSVGGGRSSPVAASSARRAGVVLAGATAAVSGVSVFVNARGVVAFSGPAVYTTAKNLVALVVLAGVALVAGGLRRRRSGAAPAGGPRGGSQGPGDGRRLARPERRLLQVFGLTYVGVVGGGVAFLLFFSGLAATTAVPAAFLHDSLVLWVALVAWPLFGERLGAANVAAVALLVVGQATLSGGVGHLVGRGQGLVLAATVLWAVEVVVAKALLATVSPAVLGVVRMGVGGAVLVADLAATGRLGSLVGMTGSQALWALVTGVLLAAYVATWFGALARARALDVTSVLVASALVTAVLGAVVDGRDLAGEAAGLALVAVGSALAVAAWPRASVLRGGAPALAVATPPASGADQRRSRA